MTATLSNSSAAQQYEEQGYVMFRDVLDAETMREAQAHLKWLLETYPGKSTIEIQNINVGTDPAWLNLVSNPRLLDIAQQFIGPDIALFATNYFCKPPGDGKVVLWHQDGSYWPLEPMEVVTLWLAIGDVNRENGCLRVIPGSHKMTLQPLHENKEIDNVLGSGMDTNLVDESAAFDCIMKPGDVEVHHPNIIHGSDANTSNGRRDGLAIRYISTRTRITHQPWETYLLRGEAVPGINEYKPRPKYIEGEHAPFRGSEGWK